MSWEQLPLWSQQPIGTSTDWLQVLGVTDSETARASLRRNPRSIHLVHTGGRIYVERPEVVSLTNALAGWLERTRPGFHLDRCVCDHQRNEHALDGGRCLILDCDCHGFRR